MGLNGELRVVVRRLRDRPEVWVLEFGSGVCGHGDRGFRRQSLVFGIRSQVPKFGSLRLVWCRIDMKGLKIGGFGLNRDRLRP